MTEENTNTQLQRAPASAMMTRFEPADMAQAMQFAELIVKSKLKPKHIESAADAFLIMAKGAELGVSSMAALQNMYVIHGKIGMHADFMAALAINSPACEYWQLIEMTAQQCTIETKRRGGAPFRHTYAMTDAERAGLPSSNPTWKKFPSNMLKARCAAELARAVYPDVMAGIYTIDELRNLPAGGGPVEVIDATIEEATPEEQRAYRQRKADTTIAAAEAMLADLDDDDHAAAESDVSDLRSFLRQWVETDDTGAESEVRAIMGKLREAVARSSSAA